MKQICKRDSCTGCGLCVSQCPVSCITLRPGIFGHLFPYINDKKCIECGLCTKNCPVLKPIVLQTPKYAFAAWSKDLDDYKSSTSGGVSSVLSQYVIRKGGVVYGCAVLPGAIIEHIRIDCEEDLFKIKGSKYVQSSIVKVINLIKRDIKDKKLVLFIGTPCQIAAIKKLFRVIPDNLFLIDLICHGTPSQLSLRNYIKRNISKGGIESIAFRSGKEYIITAYSDNSIIYTSPKRDDDYYLGAFWKGYSLRDSCHQCYYSKPRRGSDITIGDYWGLGKELPCEEIPEHKYGISLVLLNTVKGQALFKETCDSMNVYERPIDEAVNGNNRLRYPLGRLKGSKIYRLCQPLFGDKAAYLSVKVYLRFFNK